MTLTDDDTDPRIRLTTMPEVAAAIERMRLATLDETPPPETDPTPPRADPSQLRLWGVPRIHREALPGLDGEGAPDAVEHWDTRAKPVMVLAGARGNGKSFGAARWLWRHYPTDGITRESKRWWDLREVQMLGRYDRDAHRTLVTIPQLVLDELGAEPADEDAWWRSRVELLVSQRVEEGRPTLITTNESPQALTHRYGDRLVSRLRLGAWVEVDGHDLRAKLIEHRKRQHAR